MRTVEFAVSIEDEDFVMGFRADITVGGVVSIVVFLMFLQHWFFSLHEERPQPERQHIVLLQFTFGLLLVWMPTILIVLFARESHPVLHCPCSYLPSRPQQRIS
jgi:hypothetical protein